MNNDNKTFDTERMQSKLNAFKKFIFIISIRRYLSLWELRRILYSPIFSTFAYLMDNK